MFANLVQLEFAAPKDPSQAVPAPTGKPPDEGPSPFAVFLQTLQGPTGALMGQPMPATAASAPSTKSPAKNTPNLSSDTVPTSPRATRGQQPAANVGSSSSAANPLPALSTPELVSPVAPAIVPPTAVELDPVSNPVIAEPGVVVDSKPTPLPSQIAQGTGAHQVNSPALDLAGELSENIPSVGSDPPAPDAVPPDDASTGVGTNKQAFNATGFPGNAAARSLDLAPQIQTAPQPAMFPVGVVPLAASIATPSHAESAAKQTVAISDPVATLMQESANPTKSATAGAPLIVAGEKTSAEKTWGPPVTTASRILAGTQVTYTASSHAASVHVPPAGSLTDDLSVAPRAESHQQPMASAGEIHPKSNSDTSTAESVDPTSSTTPALATSDSTNAALNSASAIVAAPNPAVPASGFVAAPSSPVEPSILPPTSQAPGNASPPPPATAPKPDAPEPTAAGTGPVQMARLVNGITQSEMHIGLRTQAFGNVELHTVVRDSQLGLVVGSEKGNLRNFLNAEMPTLQAGLGQHDIRFDGIRFLENSAGVGTGFSGGAEPQHSRSFNQANSSADPDLTSNDLPEISLEEEIATEGNSKISVLA